MIICKSVRGMDGVPFQVIQSDKPYTNELQDAIKQVNKKYCKDGLIHFGQPLPASNGTYAVPILFDADVLATKKEGEVYVYTDYESSGDYIELDKLGWRFI